MHTGVLSDLAFNHSADNPDQTSIRVCLPIEYKSALRKLAVCEDLYSSARGRTGEEGVVDRASDGHQFS